MIEIGISNKIEYKVEELHSAKNVGSGDLLVLSTPSLIAFMENCAKRLIEKDLNSDDTSVGIGVNMSHIAPSKLDEKVVIACKVINIEKRIITFEIEAYDSKKLIAKATHQRCIVNKERFMGKLI